MGQEPPVVTCPFLGEVVMEYCGAYPIRKPVPKGRFAAGICAGAGHVKCPYFNEFSDAVGSGLGHESACSHDAAEEPAGGPVFRSSPARTPGRGESAQDSNAREGSRSRQRRRVSLRHVCGFLLHPGFFYHRGHTWVMPYANEEARIGLDDLGQRLLHGARKIHLPPRKVLLREGQPAVKVDCGDRSAWLVSPVDGVVTAVNQDLAEDVSLLTRDPYGDGWLLAVRLHDDSFATFPTGGAAAEWLRSETDRLCTLVHEGVGRTATDGGDLVCAPAATLSTAHWESVARAFFLHPTDASSELPTS